VERVFSNGWAFDYHADGKLIKKLDGLTVHLVGVAGADAGTFERHGCQAMATQIEHGIFDYCGAEVLSTTLLTDSEIQDNLANLERARQLGERLFEDHLALA
jgi:NAD(P)H dehydrogenase (quinone)